ncbi:hypothetical protein [Solimonas soli]|uniref:hypothetical protein n=1 Tax=Solimonas soli TaxID=413479 RepID=UPI0004805AE3|nr:hypothetical protein [Solimonas soli]
MILPKELRQDVLYSVPSTAAARFADIGDAVVSMSASRITERFGGPPGPGARPPAVEIAKDGPLRGLDARFHAGVAGRHALRRELGRRPSGAGR